MAEFFRFKYYVPNRDESALDAHTLPGSEKCDDLEEYACLVGLHFWSTGVFKTNWPIHFTVLDVLEGTETEFKRLIGSFLKKVEA